MAIFKKWFLSSSVRKWISKYIDIERIFHGLFWISIGNAFSSIASFATNLILAKSLGAHIFGQFSLIQSTLAVFIVLSGPSLGYMATKYIAEYRHKDPRRTAAVLKLSSIAVSLTSAAMGVVLLLMAPYIATEIMRAPDLVTELYLSAAILFFTGVNAAQMGALSGFEAFREVAIINIFKGAITFLLVVVGGHFYGTVGVFSGLMLASFLVCIISYQYIANLRAINKLPRITKIDLFAEVNLLLSFSLPNWLFSLVTSIANISTYIMLSRLSDGYLQLGIFNIANQFFLLLNFVPVILWQISFPMLSKISGEEDFGRLKRSYRKLMVINIIAIALLIAVVCPFSKILMNHLGQGFAEQESTLLATLFLTFFYVSANVAWQIMLVLGRIWTSLWFVIFHACIYLYVFSIFESNGAYGLAIARIIAYGIYAVITILYIEALFRSKLKEEVI